MEHTTQYLRKFVAGGIQGSNCECVICTSETESKSPDRPPSVKDRAALEESSVKQSESVKGSDSQCSAGELGKTSVGSRKATEEYPAELTSSGSVCR